MITKKFQPLEIFFPYWPEDSQSKTMVVICFVILSVELSKRLSETA